MLPLLLVPAALALMLVKLRGGRITDLGGVRIVAPWFLLAVSGLQLARILGVHAAISVLGPQSHHSGNAIVFVLVAAWLVVNLVIGEPRMALAWISMAIGLLANALVIAANGYMPYSLQAARWSGAAGDVIGTTADGYQPIVAETNLRVLADVIPVPLTGKSISLGDVMMMAGAFLGVLCACGVLRVRIAMPFRRGVPSLG